MKTKIKNIEDYNLYREENGNVIAELKRKSLKLKDIIKEQEYKDDEIFVIDSCTGIEKRKYFSTITGQSKESSARKTMLFGQIQRIADYANGDWVADFKNENQQKFNHCTDFGQIEVKCTIYVKEGMPIFKSEELAQQAYNDNKELFEEFFNL